MSSLPLIPLRYFRAPSKQLPAPDSAPRLWQKCLGVAVGIFGSSFFLKYSDEKNNAFRHGWMSRIYCQELESRTTTTPSPYIVTPDTRIYLWGNNYYGIANPLSDALAIPVPTPLDLPTNNVAEKNFPEMTLQELTTNFGKRVRGIAMAKKHAACIDSNGDLYQWGHGFNGLLPLIEGFSDSISAPPESVLPLSTQSLDSLSTDGSIAGVLKRSPSSLTSHGGLLSPDQVNRTPSCTVKGQNLSNIVSTNNYIFAINDKVSTSQFIHRPSQIPTHTLQTLVFTCLDAYFCA